MLKHQKWQHCLLPQLEVNIWRFIAVLLLRSKDRKYNNPLASFATCLCRQRNELRTCAKRVGGLAVTTLPGCPDGPRVHLSGPAYMPSCIGPEVRLPLHQRILWSDCCKKKCRLLCLAQVVFSYFVLHSSKIPLVLTTKVTHLRSLLFRQTDGINFVVRRVSFEGARKQSSAFSGLWVLTVASM